MLRRPLNCRVLYSSLCGLVAPIGRAPYTVIPSSSRIMFPSCANCQWRGAGTAGSFVAARMHRARECSANG